MGVTTTRFPDGREKGPSVRRHQKSTASGAHSHSVSLPPSPSLSLCDVCSGGGEVQHPGQDILEQAWWPDGEVGGTEWGGGGKGRGREGEGRGRLWERAKKGKEQWEVNAVYDSVQFVEFDVECRNVQSEV